MLKKASQLFHKKLSSDNLNNEEEPEIPRVYNELYFYGRITRQEAEEILAVNGMEDGLYLLRESITPMGNFSLSMAYEGRPVHYSIEKKIDGQFMIAEGVTFRDPVALIQHYQTHKTGFVTVPKIPCCRRQDQDAIAFRGLSYQDLHAHMRSAARNMNANLSRALGPMRESLLMHVLRTMHEKMPWFHGTISRDECIKRLEESGHESGKFIIRTRTDGQTFALTMSHEGTMRHYFILVNDGETYSIENGHRFKALIILVDHYHNKRDGLPCRLSVPCPSPDTMHNAWENYRKLSKNLTQKPGIRGQVREETTNDPALPPRRPPARTPDRPPPPIPQHEPLFWDRPVQDVEEDDDIENMPSPLGPAISQEQAEQLESIYIDIRQDVLSKDLRPDQVILEGKLGSGQFGEVRKGICQLSRSKTVPVAVKTLKNNDPAGEREILSEANLMKTLNHQHIVRMIGVCKGESLMLVMELAELGPLKKYLERHLEMKLSHQVEMMLQICDGMTYLESMDVVHRDLAARNVLLVTDHFAKISDFGMSRMVDNSSEYYLAHGPGRWPLMWYAPECLYYHKFDHKSDVWSFGVTMWEIMSFGARPYDRKKPQQILHFIESGNRLSKPRNCDDRIYRIMLSCWEFTKDLRPSFSELKDDLKKLYAEFLRDQR